MPIVPFRRHVRHWFCRRVLGVYVDVAHDKGLTTTSTATTGPLDVVRPVLFVILIAFKISRARLDQPGAGGFRMRLGLPTSTDRIQP